MYKEKQDKSFKAFLKTIPGFFKNHPTEVGYFGEIIAWTLVGAVLSWLIFPQTWIANPSDFSGLLICAPFFGFGILRGIYHLWKEEDD